MPKAITGSEYVLQDIFCSKFDFEIPHYQRPYAWTTEQTNELFDDLYQFFSSEDEKENRYFLGCIVLIKNENGPRSQIVDGQQRLVTLTILLSILAAKLSNVARQMSADSEEKERYSQVFDNCKAFILDPGNLLCGVPSKPRIALRKRDNEFFYYYVQKFQFEKLFGLKRPQGIANDAQENIQTNAQLLWDLLDDPKRFPCEETLLEFAQFIVQCCCVVVVSTPDEKSAFRVFSVLNNRGLDLLPCDIIKADIIGSISIDNPDEYSEHWESMEADLGRDRFNSLLVHIRMMKARVKAKQSLLEIFSTDVFNKKTPSSQECVDFIKDTLFHCTGIYKCILNNSWKSSEQPEKVNECLRWLNRIDHSDWIPPAMLYLLEPHSDQEIVHFLAQLERLASYLHITAKTINTRIERYASVLNGIDSGSWKSAIELSSQEKYAFFTALNGNVYNMYAGKRNYLLLRLDSFLKESGAIYEENVMSIEHVLPQTITGVSYWQERWSEESHQTWLHRLANLVPLSFRKNVQVSNKDFPSKKAGFIATKCSPWAMTLALNNYADWTPEIVEQRQKELLDTLVSGWQLDGYDTTPAERWKQTSLGMDDNWTYFVPSQLTIHTDMAPIQVSSFGEILERSLRYCYKKAEKKFRDAVEHGTFGQRIRTERPGNTKKIAVGIYAGQGNAEFMHGTIKQVFTTCQLPTGNLP
ncbi:MAG: DUF262 domain-containing HNH endonuclease family protein [Thermoguttaceae bacterium]|nr:DUF262 domain-containing HNH endonuclease family protein [Thermoguttaceae bacterium]